MHDQTDTRLIDYLEEERIRKRGMNAFVTGILSLSFGWIPFIGWFFLPFMIIAMVLGGFALFNPRESVVGFFGFLMGASMLIFKFGFWIVLLSVFN